MKVQQVTTDSTRKQASAPYIEHDYGHQQQNASIYPTIPQYLVSSSTPSHFVQQTPIYVTPQNTNVMYYPVSYGNAMIVPNNGVLYTPPQMINNPPPSNQQPQQPVTEEEKPYFVHTLNRHTDTLMKLALRYNCTEEDIKMLNSLLCDDLDLFEGKVLYIPKCDPNLIKKNYDLEDAKLQTERQRQVMVTTFAKNNNITIDESKVYLEMNDWNSRQAQEELIQDQAWEKQTTGNVKKPSDFNEPKTKTYTTASSNNRTITHRSRKEDKYPQYGFELMNYER